MTAIGETALWVTMVFNAGTLVLLVLTFRQTLRANRALRSCLDKQRKINELLDARLDVQTEQVKRMSGFALVLAERLKRIESIVLVGERR